MIYLINQRKEGFMMPLILALMQECQVLHHCKCFQPKIIERKKYSKSKICNNKAILWWTTLHLAFLMKRFSCLAERGDKTTLKSSEF